VAVGRLDLEVQRNLGELLRTTFETFRGHAAVFLSLTLVVVAPVVVLVDGVWGRGFVDGSDADVPVGANVASMLLSTIVVPTLVTALYVVVLQALARGEQPTVSAAFDAAAERVGAAIAAVALYIVLVAVGMFALVLPGIWLAVRLYFAAQVAVVDGATPVDALRRSAELVKGRWWATFGALLASVLLFAVLGLVVSAAVVAIEQATGSGAVWVLGLVAVQTLVLSLTALFGTLLFFDLRSRRRWPAAPTRSGRGPGHPAEDRMVAPERPSLGSPP
jgi:hypothetical protein